MFWLRTFAFGFFGALLVLLIAPRPSRECAVYMPPAAEPAPAPAAGDVTVVDVAPGVTGDMLAQMIVLAANERIVAIDDVPVTSGVAALATHELASREYIDVSIADTRGATRRALVLLR
jgi:hypothetical protein